MIYVSLMDGDKETSERKPIDLYLDAHDGRFVAYSRLRYIRFDCRDGYRWFDGYAFWDEQGVRLLRMPVPRREFTKDGNVSLDTSGVEMLQIVEIVENPTYQLG